jgi:hypothetical protein
MMLKWPNLVKLQYWQIMREVRLDSWKCPEYDFQPTSDERPEVNLFRMERLYDKNKNRAIQAFAANLVSQWPPFAKAPDIPVHNLP